MQVRINVNFETPILHLYLDVALLSYLSLLKLVDKNICDFQGGFLCKPSLFCNIHKFQ